MDKSKLFIISNDCIVYGVLACCLALTTISYSGGIGLEYTLSPYKVAKDAAIIACDHVM